MPDDTLKRKGKTVPQIVVLPHHALCPDGAVIEAPKGQSICDALLANDIDIEHACEKSCACTTCHVIVREGSALTVVAYGTMVHVAEAVCREKGVDAEIIDVGYFPASGSALSEAMDNWLVGMGMKEGS